MTLKRQKCIENKQNLCNFPFFLISFSLFSIFPSFFFIFSFFLLFFPFFSLQVYDRNGLYDKMGLQLKALKARPLRQWCAPPPPHYRPGPPPGSRSMSKIGTWFLIVHVNSLDRKCPKVNHPSGAFGENGLF